MKHSQPRFLPMSVKEAEKLGIREFDIILVTGDAYVDHPSFGTALIGRVLWDAGYSVGVIARPDWKGNADLQALGKPRLFFGVSAGNVDSMVNHYTPALKRRNDDVYAPGGNAGGRPDRAVTVYADRLHALFPGTPVVLGGIEASLRRFAHYDYWSDSVRHSVLADAPADLLVFGMAEHQVVCIADALAGRVPAGKIRTIPGTCYRVSLAEWRDTDPSGFVILPSFTEVSGSREAYARAFRMHYLEQDPYRGRPVAQVHPKSVIIQNVPAAPLGTTDLDRVYSLPFSRKAHPLYRDPVPALEPVKFSITAHRGCFGACSFCALSHHQGRIVSSRSMESILAEAEHITKMPGFHGVIEDVGGPSANMYGASCAKWSGAGTCPDRECMQCPSLQAGYENQVELLQNLGNIPGIRHVFVSSGIRYDLDGEGWDPYIREIVYHHTSGHLKVAPEHISPAVLALMNKPPKEVFEKFLELFGRLCREAGREQYILPYLMSGHPGCTIEDMISLALYLRDHSLYTEQVQDFTPTPMSVSTCMYHTGLNPFTMKPVHVPKGHEKQVQRAILHYRDPSRQALVREGLERAGRTDLIGRSPGCLVPPASGSPGIPRRKNHGSPRRSN